MEKFLATHFTNDLIEASQLLLFLAQRGNSHLKVNKYSEIIQIVDLGSELAVKCLDGK